MSWGLGDWDTHGLNWVNCVFCQCTIYSVQLVIGQKKVSLTRRRSPTRLEINMSSSLRSPFSRMSLMEPREQYSFTSSSPSSYWQAPMKAFKFSWRISRSYRKVTQCPNKLKLKWFSSTIVNKDSVNRNFDRFFFIPVSNFHFTSSIQDPKFVKKMYTINIFLYKKRIFIQSIIYYTIRGA